MANVLVTGATGFIGSNLTRQLVARGERVTCLVRNRAKAAALEPLGVQLAFADIRDADAVGAAVRGVDTVYHLAGLATAFRAEELIEVNATAFRHLVTSCAGCPTPPRIVSVSSLAAAGPSSANRPRTEQDPPAPVSHYGRAKRAAELIAEEFADRVPITIVRPPIVFGEGDLQMRNVFRSISRFGVHFAFGVDASRYSLVHVSDLVDALIASAERGATLAPRPLSNGKRARGYYFAACDEQPTFAELGRLIAQSLGRQSVYVCRRLGSTVLWPAAAASEVIARVRRRPYIFNFDKVREARAGHWTCSSQAIREELGFAPRFSLADRLLQTTDWYREHGLL